MEGGAVAIWQAGHGPGDVDALAVWLVVRHGLSRLLVCVTGLV